MAGQGAAAWKALDRGEARKGFAVGEAGDGGVGVGPGAGLWGRRGAAQLGLLGTWVWGAEALEVRGWRVWVAARGVVMAEQGWGTAGLGPGERGLRRREVGMERSTGGLGPGERGVGMEGGTGGWGLGEAELLMVGGTPGVVGGMSGRWERWGGAVGLRVGLVAIGLAEVRVAVAAAAAVVAVATAVTAAVAAAVAALVAAVAAMAGLVAVVPLVAAVAAVPAAVAAPGVG